jgi:DNA-binding NarL/FixJ family response regulator
MKKPITILLVEDHPEYREVIEIALTKDPDLQLVSQFGTAEMALRSVQERTGTHKPDIILLDLNLPGMSGLDAIPWFQKYTPDSQIIVLTQSDIKADVLQAIRLGASGYLLKSSTVDTITNSIRSVMDGGAPIDAGVAKYILSTLKNSLPKQSPPPTLSAREMEILTLLAEGLAKKEIASRLKIGESTVVTHVSHIYEKLNALNAPGAIHKAHTLGLFRKQS